MNENNNFLLFTLFSIMVFLFISSCNQKQEKRANKDKKNEKLVYVNGYGQVIDTISSWKISKMEAEALTKHWKKYPQQSSHINGRSQNLHIKINNYHVEILELNISTKNKEIDLSLLHKLKYLKELSIAAPIINAEDLINLSYLDTLYLSYTTTKHFVFPQKLRNLKYLDTYATKIEEITFPKGVDWQIRKLSSYETYKFQSDTLKHLRVLGIGKVDTLNLGLFPNLEIAASECKNIKSDTLYKLKGLRVGNISSINLNLFPNLEWFRAESNFLDTTYLKQKYPHIEMNFYGATD